MSSLAGGPRVGKQRPNFALVPEYVATSGPEFAELAEIAGVDLDDWQRYCLDSSLGEKENGDWAARYVGIWSPRQNGKSELAPVLALGYLFLTRCKLVLLSAHQYKTASEIWLRLRTMIESSPMLKERVLAIREAAGEQGLTIKPQYGGGRLRVVARSRSAIRGFSVDGALILDEAQEITHAEMAAMLPVISAQKNPQLVFLGTPPDPDKPEPAWCYDLRDDARRGEKGICFLNWGLDLDLRKPADLKRVSDIDSAYASNPALGVRITEDTVLQEMRPSGLGDRFAFERLGVWPPRSLNGATVDLAQWGNLGDDTNKRDRTRGCALAVDRSPLGDYSAISIFGLRPDGRGYLQLLDYRPGSDWVAARLVDWKRDLKPMAVAIGNGTYSALEPDLTKVGILKPKDPQKRRRGDLVVTRGSDMSAATSQFMDGVSRGNFRHLPVEQLDKAVSGAKVRNTSDGVVWSRKDASVDISPLVSASLALWAFREPPDHDIEKSIMILPLR